MTTRTISIAKDFSPTPAGRYRSDGPFPGESFRDDLLLPALSKTIGPVTVELDGTAGFGSSFLEEAFGGLVRSGIDPRTLRERLRIESSHPSYVARVWSYIDHASDRKK
jgi:hypothetical protein